MINENKKWTWKINFQLVYNQPWDLNRKYLYINYVNIYVLYVKSDTYFIKMTASRYDHDMNTIFFVLEQLNSTRNKKQPFIPTYFLN